MPRAKNPAAYGDEVIMMVRRLAKAPIGRVETDFGDAETAQKMRFVIYGYMKAVKAHKGAERTLGFDPLVDRPAVEYLALRYALCVAGTKFVLQPRSLQPMNLILARLNEKLAAMEIEAIEINPAAASLPHRNHELDIRAMFSKPKERDASELAGEPSIKVPIYTPQPGQQAATPNPTTEQLYGTEDEKDD